MTFIGLKDRRGRDVPIQPNVLATDPRLKNGQSQRTHTVIGPLAMVARLDFHAPPSPVAHSMTPLPQNNPLRRFPAPKKVEPVYDNVSCLTTLVISASPEILSQKNKDVCQSRVGLDNAAILIRSIEPYRNILKQSSITLLALTQGVNP